MLFRKLLEILDGEKQVQVYAENGFNKTLPKAEWEKDGQFADCQVLKVKNRPTDRYVFIELNLEGSTAA